MRSWALFHLKGGVGKTTAAVHLAHLSARAGMRTLLWDLDPQGASSWMFRVRVSEETRPKRLLRDPEVLEQAVRASDWPGLDVLPADLSLTRLEKVLRDEERPEEVLAAALATLAPDHERIVIDCAPTLTPVTQGLFGSVDALVVPTIPTALSLRTLATLHAHLKPWRRRGLQVLPFFSMVDARKAMHRRVRAFARAEGLGFLATEIPYSAHVERTAARRTPLTASGDHPVGALFEELRQEIEARLAASTRPKLERGRLLELVRELGG